MSACVGLPQRLSGLISDGWENPINKPRRQGGRAKNLSGLTPLPLLTAWYNETAEQERP